MKRWSSSAISRWAAFSPATLCRRYTSQTCVLLQQRSSGYGSNAAGGGRSGGAPYGRGATSYSSYGGSQQQQQQPSSRGGPPGGGRGGFGRGGGPRGARGGQAPRRAPEQFLAQNAEKLLELKRGFKQAKSAKERRTLQREARRVIRGARVDPSTQDEKSVTILLNCAALFHANGSESIEQAVQWARKNLNGLSPQNIALFANAIGSLQLSDGDVILEEEVSPVVQAVLREMTPVEVVMVLQAFQRERVSDNMELQDQLLRQLAPCIGTMPLQQLSTLATVLGRHSLKHRDEPAWHAMVESVTAKITPEVQRMHSKEAITFLGAAAAVRLPQEQITQLLDRAIATAGFHTSEQIGDLFRAMAAIRRDVAEPSPELQRAGTELERALIGRLERVAEYVTPAQAASLWRYSKACGVTLPTAVQQIMESRLLADMAWSRQRIPSLVRVAREAAGQPLPSAKLLDAIADCAIGRRLERPGRGPVPPDPRTAEEIAAARERLGTVRFASLVALRLYLEDAYAANGGTPTDSLTKVLPEMLAKCASSATPRQVVIAVEHIATAAEGCALRNGRNDDAILAVAEARVTRDPAAFMEKLSPAFVKRSTTVLENAPRAKALVDALKANAKS